MFVFSLSWREVREGSEDGTWWTLSKAPGISCDWKDALMSSHLQWHFTRSQLTTVITPPLLHTLKREVTGYWAAVFIGFFFSSDNILNSKTLSLLWCFPCLLGVSAWREIVIDDFYKHGMGTWTSNSWGPWQCVIQLLRQFQVFGKHMEDGGKQKQREFSLHIRHRLLRRWMSVQWPL